MGRGQWLKRSRAKYLGVKVLSYEIIIIIVDKGVVETTA